MPGLKSFLASQQTCTSTASLGRCGGLPGMEPLCMQYHRYDIAMEYTRSHDEVINCRMYRLSSRHRSAPLSKLRLKGSQNTPLVFMTLMKEVPCHVISDMPCAHANISPLFVPPNQCLVDENEKIRRDACGCENLDPTSDKVSHSTCVGWSDFYRTA